MGFIIGLFTLIMILDCIVLVLLVLIQLPKKEAGAGLAFGGSASDALFGAGSGNVLTKITKWSAGAFFVLAVMLSIMRSHYQGRGSDFNRRVSEQSRPPAESMPAPAPAPAAAPQAPAMTNLLRSGATVEASNMPPSSATVTNLAAPAATNSATTPSPK